MLIQHTTALLEDRFSSADIRLDGGRILEIGSDLTPNPGEEVFDAENKVLLPGFVDVHTHAYGGFDTMNGEADVRAMSREYGKLGVAAFLPTTMSAGEADTRRVLGDIRKVMAVPEPDGAKVAGAHMEAPFLNKAKKGAQRDEFFLTPSLSAFLSICDHHPETVRMITLAPELEGSDALIPALADLGITVSAGHTGATAEDLHHAADLGLTHATHLFNAHPALHHRAPGSVGAALTDSRVACEVICDGEHLHPDTVRLVLAAKGPALTVAVTDSMEAAGMPEGEYALGGQKVFVKNGRALLADGTLAGSVLTMPRILKNLIAWGIAPETAAALCTSSPADSVGLEGFGRIRVGYDSTLTLWSPDWDLLRVFR